MVTSVAMSMGPLPGRSAFTGPVHDLGPAPETAFAGQAHFSGCLVATAWPRADAERLLPPELELAPSASAAAIHPVLFSFGDQRTGSFLLGGVPIEAGPTYREFCVVVPFVRRRGGQNLHLYCPRICSTSYPAYWHGNASYGLRKAMTRMGWERESSFVVTSPAGDQLAHADVERITGWQRPTDQDPPGLAALRTAFALPIAGRRDDGTLVSSYFRWELGDALVRPVRAAVSIVGPLAEGNGRGSWQSAPSQAFEVQGMLWRITWPMAPRF